MNTGQKREKAKEILAELDALFHTAEKANPDHAVTYLDIVRITDRVREHFKEKTPPQIEGALSIAIGICHPKKIEGIEKIKKGFGFLMSCTGGASLLWGIVYILAVGLTATTITGALWWKTTTVTILFGGPVGIAIGVASLALGIYILSKKAPVKMRAVVALDVIKNGIESWVLAELKRDLPDMSWVEKLNSEEYQALISSAWYMIEADDVLHEGEMALIDHLFSVRKPTDENIIKGIGTISMSKAIKILESSYLKEECFRFLRIIPGIDGVVSPEEEDLLNLLETHT